MSDDSSSNSPPLDVAALEGALQGLRLGAPLVYFPALPSTNTYAAQLAQEGTPEGTLVTTDDQSAGRGRIGRTWKSLPGRQLALSLVLRPAFPPHFLVMASAVAVAEAIEEGTGLRAEIKWPNDVQITGRKVCGILIETSPGYTVLGIGVNVNGSLSGDAELAAHATTLADASGHAIAREALAAALLRRLDALYGALKTGGDPDRAVLRDMWRARLITLGRRVTIAQQETTLVGDAEDVDADGALLLRLDDGTRRTVTWGDVSS